eukprot:8348387-Ditylum_brightwellii.AAC.1
MKKIDEWEDEMHHYFGMAYVSASQPGSIVRKFWGYAVARPELQRTMQTLPANPNQLASFNMATNCHTMEDNIQRIGSVGYMTSTIDRFCIRKINIEHSNT